MWPSMSGSWIAALSASAVQIARNRQAMSSAARIAIRLSVRIVSKRRTPRRSSGLAARTSRLGRESGSTSLSSLTRLFGTDGFQHHQVKQLVRANVALRTHSGRPPKKKPHFAHLCRPPGGESLQDHS